MSTVMDVVSEMERLIEGIPSLKGKVFHVYGEDDLIERTKAINFPYAAVVYDGIRSSKEEGATSRVGASGEIVVTVMVFFRNDARASNDPKEHVLMLLDTLRKHIMGTKSPTGHKWQFQYEAAAEGKKGLLAYTQRWSTPIQLVS